MSRPCNLIGPLNFFQVREDCDQFRIVNGTGLLLNHHKGHRSNNKDSCSKSIPTCLLCGVVLLFGNPKHKTLHTSAELEMFPISLGRPKISTKSRKTPIKTDENYTRRNFALDPVSFNKIVPVLTS